ncbi:clavaminate synthase-like protein [Iris pallida]|uniref:Clavaminate synthase-like protein n=1 Tax=Iris pallida TaxID=29817 RepID=A0AAX6EN83_IRIPA|nr:clavaminate synthase-like protein [Iris pallida]
MGFTEGHIEEEREFHGRVFPKTLLPPSEGGRNSCGELVELVAEERVRLSELLGEHGAVLLRGFAVGSAEEFSSVVEAFGWDEYVFDGANRTEVAERVYTASAAPLHVVIPFHHEMAMIKEFPRKIFFYCLQPAPEGGQTSIIRSDVIVEKLQEKVPQVVEKLERCGLKTILRARRKSWQRMLVAEDA